MANYEFPKFDIENDNACPIDYCKQITKIALETYTASCVFAREGTLQVEKIIEDISNGKAKSDDYELLVDLTEIIKNNTISEVVKEAMDICKQSLVDYESDWDKHMKRGICKNLICDGLYNLYIDPITCVGCGECKKIRSSINGSEGMIHIIDNNDIIDDKKSLINICPNGAIKRYGQSKPKVPTELVPVGSYVPEETSTRRRKKRK